MTTTAPPTSTTPPPAPRRPRTLRTVLLVVGSVLLVALLALVVVQSVAAADRQDHSRTSAVDESFDRIRIDTVRPTSASSGPTSTHGDRLRRRGHPAP